MLINISLHVGVATCIDNPYHVHEPLHLLATTYSCRYLITFVHLRNIAFVTLVI